MDWGDHILRVGWMVNSFTLRACLVVVRQHNPDCIEDHGTMRYWILDKSNPEAEQTQRILEGLGYVPLAYDLSSYPGGDSVWEVLGVAEAQGAVFVYGRDADIEDIFDLEMRTPGLGDAAAPIGVLATGTGPFPLDADTEPQVNPWDRDLVDDDN